MANYLIPIAISSQLDDTGVERVHAAPRSDRVRVYTEICAEDRGFYTWGGSGSNANMVITGGIESAWGVDNAPQWLIDLSLTNGSTFIVDFFDNGVYTTYETDGAGGAELVSGQSVSEGDYGRGVIYSADMSQSVCFIWQIPTAG